MEAWPAEIPPVDLTPDKTQTPLVENATLGISRSQKKERKRMNLFVPNLIFYRIKEGSRLTGLSESTTHPKRPSRLLFLTIGPKTKKKLSIGFKKGLGLISHPV